MPTALPPSLGRLAVVLLALAVVPALALVAVQVYVQSESERQLAQIRDQQLDGLLFSVNQDAWDVASVWADRLARETATNEGGMGAQAFLAATPAVRLVVEGDTSGRSWTAIGSNVPPGLRADGDTLGTGGVQATPQTLSTLFERERVALLLDQHAVGYRKLEPVALDGGGLALVFVADGLEASDPPRLLGMILDPVPFVGAVVMPKLREVAQGGVSFAVFMGDAEDPVASTSPVDRSEVQRERPLWLLPAYTVGVRVGEGSAEVALRRRLFQSLLLIGGVTAALGVGALVVWRGVRREVEVARLREDFVSNVSHELRTPLALIRMYSESLAQGRVPPERLGRYYDTIVAETERLSRLVGNVLHFNRFERGTASLSRAPIDVSALAAEIGERYRPVIERDGGTLALDLASDLPAVSGDRDLLSEALVNLIDNAVKYGGGQVEVGTERQGDGVALAVADRGPGIHRDDAERVFEPFVRLQPTSTDGLVHTAKGTGLGLALVQRIAASHGGTATVEPRDGGGSVFRLTLPSHA